jgi:hypothetical protein
MRLSRACGLAARQRVSLTLERFDDLRKNDKNELFKNSIQAYVEYPKELKEKRKKVAMKIISHAWRNYKSRLVKCLRNQKNPFNMLEDLTQEDWERFVTMCESTNFVVNSKYMRWLRSHNELDHQLCNTRYVGKQRHWQQEDDILAQQGLENPYVKFHRQLTPFMRAYSKLIKSGDVSFYR